MSVFSKLTLYSVDEEWIEEIKKLETEEERFATVLSMMIRPASFEHKNLRKKILLGLYRNRDKYILIPDLIKEIGLDYTNRNDRDNFYYMLARLKQIGALKEFKVENKHAPLLSKENFSSLYRKKFKIGASKAVCIVEPKIVFWLVRTRIEMICRELEKAVFER